MKKILYLLKFTLIATFLVALSVSLMGQTYSVQVIQPNGGETWAAGTRHLISWTDNLSGKVDILLSKDGGSNFTDTVATNIKGSTYSWKIPSNLSGTDFKIRVQSSIDENTGNTSKTFSIKEEGYIKVLQPNHKDIQWAMDTKHLISWEDNVPGKVNIVLVDNNKDSIFLAKNVKGNTWAWSINGKGKTSAGTSTAYSEGTYSIAIAAVGSTIKSKTAATFEISTNPTGSYIKLIQPTAGKIAWAMNTKHLISWKDNLSGSVNIILEETGKSDIYLAKNVKGSTWAWNINGKGLSNTYELGSDYKIKVVSSDDPTNTDLQGESKHEFAITDKASGSFIQLLQPNKKGIKWAINTKHLISWKDNFPGKVNIVLIDDKSNDSIFLAKNVKGSTWAWNINEKGKTSNGNNTNYSEGTYRIAIVNVGTNLKSKTAYNFEITKSPAGSFIKVLQPTMAKISWAMNTKHLISWNDNLSGRVNILLHDNNSGNDYTLAKKVKGSTWVWNISGKGLDNTGNYSKGDHYIIKIESVDDPNNNNKLTAESKHEFAITAVPSGSFIKVLQPSDKNMEWAQGTSHLISWKDNLTGKVNLSLVKCQANGSINYPSPWTLYTHANTNKGIPGPITALAVDTHGNIWVGCDNGLAKFDGTKWTTYTTPNFLGKAVSSIVIDASGNIWVGTYNSYLAKFDGTKWTTYNFGFTSIAVDASGNIWGETNFSSNGLFKFNGSSWTNYSSTNSGLPSGNVNSIAIDNSGNIWVGTNKGLAKFDGSSWTAYTSSNSNLPGNYITSIALDASDNIWVGTDKGLAKFDGTKWTTYTSGNTTIPIPNNGITALAFHNGIKLIGANTAGLLVGRNGTATTYLIKKDVLGSTYPWKITSGFPVYKYYKLRVTSVEDTTLYAESKNTFGITDTPAGSYIKIEQPTGGESWATGTQHLISWTGNLTGKYDIILKRSSISDDSTVLYTNIPASTHAWTIDPNTTPADDYYIKIRGHQYTTVADSSKDFSIIQKLNINTYPNPSTNFINVKVSEAVKNVNYSVTVYNRYGLKVWQGHLNTNNSHEIRVSTFDLPNGIYFISMTGGSKPISRTFIVQH